MVINKEELKKKIIYRSSYRGSKEMDTLMTSFVNSIINDLDIENLLKLSELVNLDDENLYKLKYATENHFTNLDEKLINKFRKFKS